MRGIKTVTAVILLALVFAFGKGTPSAPAGLRANWSFEENSGARVYDSSGNHNIGIVRGDPYYPPVGGMGNFNPWVAPADFERRAGAAGKALYLKNKSFVEMPDTDDIRLGGPFTIEGRWLYAPNLNQVLFYKGQNERRHNYYAAISSGKVVFSGTDINGTIHSISVKAPPAGGWHLLDFVYNGRALLIYIDQTLAGSNTIGAVQFMTAFDQGLLIGAERNHLNRLSSVLEGAVDEIRIYDEALAPERMGQPPEQKTEIPGVDPAPDSWIQRTLRRVGLKHERLTVTRSGQAAAAIVIRKDYTELQSVPAKELQRYIEKLTGARLPVLTDDAACRGNMILVGASRYTRELGVETEKMTGDSYVIRSFPGRLVLAGHDDILDLRKPEYEITDEPVAPSVAGYYRLGLKTVKNGTLNAVYSFLQDYCGVRWFMPGDFGEYVPERHDLDVSKLDITDQPYRGYMTCDSGFKFYQCWKNRNFIGESAQTFTFDMSHDWEVLVPFRHYAAHPEWFAMRPGWSTNSLRIRRSLCTSNLAMREEALKNLKLIYSQGFEIVGLSQCDGYVRCQCPDCEAMDDYRGDPYYTPGSSADRIWIFEDYLAREIQKTHPDRKIILYSYGPTGEVPDRNKIPKFSDNVIMGQCLNDTSTFRAQLERWKKYHPAPYGIYYVYWFCPETGNHLPQSYDYVAGELKTLVSSYGGRSFWLCGGGCKWNVNAPIYYMMACLLRNPQQDPKAILDEFCANLFGSSAGAMRAYFTALYSGYQRVLDESEKRREQEAANTGAGEIVRGRSIPLSERYLISYPDEILDACERDLTRALKSAGNETIKKRIEFFADGFEALKLTAQGFRSLKESEAADWSKETVQKLFQVMTRRNSFIADASKRLSNEHGDLIADSYPGFDGGFEPFRMVKNMSTNSISEDGPHVAVVIDSSGVNGIIAALTNSNQKFFPIFTPVFKDLSRHPALIISQPTEQIEAYNDSISQLRDYVKNGGAVMLTHDTVGYRKFKAAFPEIGKGAGGVVDANAVIAANHEITSGMKTGDSFKHAYCDHIILEKGPQGTVICADTKGRPVMVVGSFGKGRVILNGMITGYASNKDGDYNGKDKEPEGMERQLLLNGVKWLKSR